MINPYFTFTSNGENFCCYKTSNIIYINFYIDPNGKYKMQIQNTGDTAENIAVYPFKDKEYWETAQNTWTAIMKAAQNEAINNTNIKYYNSIEDIAPWW